MIVPCLMMLTILYRDCKIPVGSDAFKKSCCIDMFVIFTTLSTYIKCIGNLCSNIVRITDTYDCALVVLTHGLYIVFKAQPSGLPISAIIWHPICVPLTHYHYHLVSRKGYWYNRLNAS